MPFYLSTETLAWYLINDGQWIPPCTIVSHDLTKNGFDNGSLHCKIQSILSILLLWLFQTPATGNFQKPALFAASFLCQQFLLSRFSSCNFCSAFLWFHQGAATVSNKEAGAKLILKSTVRDRTPCTGSCKNVTDTCFIFFSISYLPLSSLESVWCPSSGVWPLSSVLQRQYGCPSSSAEVGRWTDGF